MPKKILISPVFIVLIFVFVLIPWKTNATALGDLAVSMAPGTWAKLNTNGFTNSLLMDAGGAHHILQYTEDALWNPINKEILFIGSGHPGDPNVLGKFIRYRENTNSWEELPYNSIYKGHGYDHNAINPLTGDVYKHTPATPDFYKYSQLTGFWNQLPSINGMVAPSVAGALEYFSERNSLIFVDTAYGALNMGRVYEYSFADSLWSQKADRLAMGTYHNFAEYSPVSKVMIFGGGNDGRQVYKMTSAGIITQMNDASFNIGINSSVITVDPVSGKFLVMIPGSLFYEYTGETDTWRQLPSPPVDMSPSSGAGIIATPVSTYGVTFFGRYNSGNPEVWFYKHSAQASDTTAPTTPINLSAIAISSSQINLSWTASTDNIGVTGYRIYRGGVQVGTSATNSYSDTGLFPSTTYSYTVAAYDAAGNVSSQSISANATTQASTGRVINIYSGTNVFGTAVQSLQAGDTLIVHAGTYTENNRIGISVRATAGLPVIIQKAVGESRPIIRGNLASADTINLDGAQYVTLKGLEITSSFNNFGVNLKYTGGFSPNHITLDDLVIHDIDIAVNMSDPNANYSYITVSNTQIYNTGGGGGTGEGMYIGCNNAACSVTDSLFEKNWIHDDLAGVTQGDGIEVKYGSIRNIIRDNVIYNKGTTTGYPGIFVYGYPGNTDRNIVEGNVIWNTGEGIYAVSDAIVRNNIVFGSGTGLSLYAHSQVSPMENVTAVNNTLYNNTEGIYIRWGGTNMVLANNAIYSPGKTAINSNWGVNGTVSRNYVEGGTDTALDGTRFINGGTSANAFVNAAGNNFWPKAGSPLLNNANTTYVPADDFNRAARTSLYDIGAYEIENYSFNPGWVITAGFKTAVSSDITPPAAPTGLTIN